MAAFLPWVLPLVVVATFGRLALFGGVGPVGRAAGVPGRVLSALFLVPLAWVFWVNVVHAPGSGDTVTGPSLLSYPMVLLGTSLTVGLAYSAIIAGSTAILTLVLACPAAYALARFGLPYSNGLLGVMLAVAFFPPVALLVPLLVQIAIMVQASHYTYARFQAGVIDQRNGLVRLEEIVDDSDGPILVDEYAGLLPLVGRRIYLQPFEMTQLHRDGRWDQGPLLASLERRTFPAILIWKPPYAAGVQRGRWTREMLKTIDENYRPTHKYAGTLIYRFRPSQ